MRLLDRYLLRELLAPLGFCLGGFLVFWVAFDLISQLEGFQQRQMRTADVLEFYWYGLPDLLLTVLPVGFLLALLYALTQHARHHELTAMRAAGVGLWRVCAPYLAVGLALSGGLYALNEFWSGTAKERQELLMMRRVDPNAADSSAWRTGLSLYNAADRRQWSIGAFHVIRSELRSTSVRHLLGPGARRRLTARSAVWTNGGWRVTGVTEEVFRRADDGEPARRPTDVLSFPAFAVPPAEILSWEADVVQVPVSLALTNPAARTTVVVVTNQAWRTNLVVPGPATGMVWQVKGFNPHRPELFGLSAEIPLPADAQRVIVGDRGEWRGGAWLFQQVREVLYRDSADGDPVVLQHGELRLPELTESPDVLRSEVRVAALNRGRVMRRPELTLAQIDEYLRLHPRVDPALRSLLETQRQARLAAPWTCLVVVLIAVPFGAPSGRRNVFYGVAGSIGLAFLFFVLQRIGFALAQGGQVPAALGAWLPNAAFALAGLVLTARVR